jgi:metacaspase-1
MRKKALLIGIRKIREDTVEIARENDERMKKGKGKEAAPKAPELKDPHRDVLEMEQILLSALYHDILFLLSDSLRCLEVYHYDPKDITVLNDDDDPDHIQPTKENMVVLYIHLCPTSCTKTRFQIRSMIELIEGALAGDRFFLHCLYTSYHRPSP